MPALDEIVRDQAAAGWKTLCVFVRDCVGGNCSRIDSRVSKEPTTIRRSRSRSIGFELARYLKQLLRGQFWIAVVEPHCNTDGRLSEHVFDVYRRKSAPRTPRHA